VLKCTYIYVLRMGSVLFLRDFMQVDRSVQDRLDKCDLMLNARDSLRPVPAVRTERSQSHGSGG